MKLCRQVIMQASNGKSITLTCVLAAPSTLTDPVSLTGGLKIVSSILQYTYENSHISCTLTLVKSYEPHWRSAYMKGFYSSTIMHHVFLHECHPGGVSHACSIHSQSAELLAQCTEAQYWCIMMAKQESPSPAA